jgi:hypothetical protein
MYTLHSTNIMNSIKGLTVKCLLFSWRNAGQEMALPGMENIHSKEIFLYRRKKTCPWECNEGLWGNDGMPPVILNLAPTPLYASGKSLWYQMDNKPSGSQRRSGCFEEHTRFICHSARSVFTIPTELTGSALKMNEKVY